MTVWTDTLPILAAGDFITDTVLISKIMGALHGLTDDWEDYAAVWSSSGTPPSIGNGALDANYTQSGSLVAVFIRLRWGSTTNGGTGAQSISLPVQPNNDDTALSGFVWDNSATLVFPACSRMDSATSLAENIGTHGSTGTAALVTASAPMTFATSDQVVLGGIYQAAV